MAAEAIRTLVAGLPQPVRDWRAVGRPDRLEIRLDGVDPASAGAAGAQLRDRIDALGRRITSTLPSLALLAVVPAVEDGERLRVVAAVGGETGPGSTRGSNDASAPHVTCERQLETDVDRGVPMPRRSSPGPIPASGTAPATPASDT